VYKIAISAAQFASCVFMYMYSCRSQLAGANKLKL